MSDMKAPFVYFGGKRRAAERIWEALGDPGGYVEPFAGSAAVLLSRPTVDGARVETLNDSDAWLVNTWRAIQLDPETVAEYCFGPASEIDYHARLAWLQSRRDDELVSWLEGDPEAHDSKAAAWWLYVMACGIGDPWGPGPWHVVDDRLVKLGRDGSGVNREGMVARGQGIHRAGAYLKSSGQGIHRSINYLGHGGRGIHRQRSESLGNYLMSIAERLTDVRITCGDWRRVLTPAAINATLGKPGIGILMDPPYATSGDLYASTNERGGTAHHTIAEEVREWCLTEGRGFRIVLCGFEDEHDEVLDHGWAKLQGKAGSTGMTKDPYAGQRERLWASPECYSDNGALFALSDALR